MLSVLVLLAVLVYLIFILVRPKVPKNFPPGPSNFPIVGGTLYLSKLGRVGTERYKKLGEIFGPVSGLYLGNIRTIIINGYEATKEFYSRDEFPHRPKIFTNTYRWGGRMLGVFFSNGKLWQEQKRFALRHLRDFGFGKTSMEGLIHEEAEQCIEHIKKAIKEAGPSSVIEVHDRFNVSMINILWAIIGGTRYGYQDDKFRKVLKAIQTSFRGGSVTGNFVNAYPFLRHFPYFKQEFETLTSGANAIHKILKVTIKEHEESRDPSSPRDLIDVYLQAIEESKGDPNTSFFKDQLVQVCEDFFAGAESTSNSVAFAILHVLRNPEVQEKVQKELDEVIGRDRFASFADKERLPYTYSTISESFRYSPVAAVSVPHFNTDDVKFLGYDIPKGTWAMVNFTSTHMDKKYWGEDAHQFRPERWLDQNGKFDKSKLDHVFGFGAGKRVCLGESLARITNFIFFTAVMQRLKFEPAPGQTKPTTVPVDGFSLSPQPFSAKVTVRY